MTTDDDLRALRRAYAKQVAHAAQAADPRLEDALADLPRERFLPPGPWLLARGSGGYRPTPDADPVYLYQDVPIALQPERRLNTGQPSFVAGLIGHLRLAAGETAVHVGCGTGYYTAILGRFVGPQGAVLAIEHEPDLAARARQALGGLPQVRVVEGDGSAVPLPPADAILVTAGCTHPADPWLDALTADGRLILPLTVDRGEGITEGVILLVERRGETFAARCLCGTRYYPCIGARDAASGAALAAALARGGAGRVTALRRTDLVPEEACWLRAPGWSLTYA
ncbi:protein-L-isoaspartate O-methyltransferase family protein [Methylobacterium sp. ID0610]|uniref:protein-L-isoaspartate O-methyltransferase family protein n=1 Tax=Methylobacterium carpenticola TaxID=3344827 RepID=UPI0036A1C34C